MGSELTPGSGSPDAPSGTAPLQVRLGNGTMCVLLPQDLPVAEAITPIAQTLASASDPQQRARLAADLSGALARLGEVLLERSQPAAAESLLREALELATATLGPEHSHTLAVMCRLGNSLASQSKLNEAERIDRRLLDAYQRTLGPNHVDTLTAWNNLAGDLMVQGKVDEATVMLEEAARVCQRALDPEHPASLRARSNVGAAWLQQGRLADAEREVRAVLEVQRRTAGTTDSSTQQTGRLLVDILNRQQKANEAADLQVSLGGMRVQDGCFAFIIGPQAQATRVPYQPPAPLQPLFDEAIQLGLRQLERPSLITPVCLVVTQAGERLRVPFAELCVPPLPSLARRLLPLVRQVLPAHEPRQFAMVKPVEYETGEPRTRHEALQITLEAGDDWSVVCYLPYRRVGDRVVPGELFAVNPLP